MKRKSAINQLSILLALMMSTTGICNARVHHMKHANRAIPIISKVDSNFSEVITHSFRKHRPDHGCILVCDLKTCKMLNIIEINRNSISSQPNITFQSHFPAASLIKIVTTVAALETNSKYIVDGIPCRGSLHTLFRNQILPNSKHSISLKLAFANSSNPAFGVLGISIGTNVLQSTGNRMGFNRPLDPISQPSVYIVPSSEFEIAQVACGYTKSTTISPLHALEIIRAIGDDGILRNVDLGRDYGHGDSLPFISPSNLVQLQSIMGGTVKFGTARKGFWQIFKKTEYRSFNIGGKTGTLAGDDPVGLYDWYIGYVKDSQGKGIAMCCMFVHGRKRSMKANKIAALISEVWMENEIKR